MIGIILTSTNLGCSASHPWTLRHNPHEGSYSSVSVDMASHLLHGRERVRVNRRRSVAHRGAAAHAAEDQEIKEVHPAKHEQHRPYFHRQGLDAFLCRGECVSKLERQADIAEINEIKPYDQ